MRPHCVWGEGGAAENLTTNFMWVYLRNICSRLYYNVHNSTSFSFTIRY